MAKWSDEIGGDTQYLSTKIGADITMKIIAIRRITNKPDFEPKTKDGNRQGFMYEFVGQEGIVTAGTFALQSALKVADVDVLDTIRIEHPEHGKYIVTKIKDGSTEAI